MGGAVPAGRDHLRITPDQIVAPVGSEVLLKTGICGADGYLIANQRVEWTIARAGPGQFSDFRLSDASEFLGWMEAPQVVDCWCAVGNTANVSHCLSRGTPEPADDVQIQRGESWVTLTSASEGTSLVTAFAPAYSEFSQATAAVHWIDAQWIFPPSVCADSCRPHVLTTTVVRRSDGAPIPGWLVRYDVAGGGSLGYEGGSSVEVPTDATGRASVEVSPTGTGGGTTNVVITVVRPQAVAPGMPSRMELGRGTTTITWQPGAVTGSPIEAPFTPSPIGPGPMSPAPMAPGPAAPPMTSPSPFSPQSPTTVGPNMAPTLPNTSPATERQPPPAAQAPAGRPNLDVELRQTGPEQMAVGEYASFDLTVTNRGDGVARNIQVVDRFDAGLRHPQDTRNEHAIKFSGIRDLQPNDSQTIRLTFQVVDVGNQCHEVTVSAVGAEPVTQRGCVTAQKAALEVSVVGPVRQVVGETAKFRAVVSNGGTVAATNVELVARCDANLEPTFEDSGWSRLPDGSYLLKMDRFEAGERRSFPMNARCKAASDNACATFTLSADAGITAADEACFQIVPTLSSGPLGGTAAAGNLRLTITESANRPHVGEKFIAYVNVQNTSQQPERQVSVRVQLPPELSAEASQIQPQNEATVLGQEIRFATIGELAAGQQKQYVIPLTPTRPGQVQIRGQVAVGSTTSSPVDSNVIEVLSASP